MLYTYNQLISHINYCINVKYRNKNFDEIFTIIFDNKCLINSNYKIHFEYTSSFNTVEDFYENYNNKMDYIHYQITYNSPFLKTSFKQMIEQTFGVYIRITTPDIDDHLFSIGHLLFDEVSNMVIFDFDDQLFPYEERNKLFESVDDVLLQVIKNELLGSLLNINTCANTEIIDREIKHNYNIMYDIYYRYKRTRNDFITIYKSFINNCIFTKKELNDHIRRKYI